MNKALRRYGHTKTLCQTPPQMVGTIFDRCAQWMEKIAVCLMEKNYYERYLYSEKIIMALTTFMTLLDENTEDQKRFAKEMKEFCILILSFLTEINHKEKHTLCIQTQTLLKEMATLWQKTT